MTEVSAMLVIRWALLTLGLIYLVSESAIAMHPRLWIARRGAWAMLFVYCAACTGFWIGLATSHWLWPFDLVGADVQWVRYLEGGVAAMTLGAIWKSLNGGNPAFEVEAELLHDDPQPKAEEPNGDED